MTFIMSNSEPHQYPLRDLMGGVALGVGAAGQDNRLPLPVLRHVAWNQI